MDLSLLEAIVWPVAIFISMLITILIGLFGLVGYWQSKTTQELDTTRKTLRAAQSSLARLRSGVQAFTPEDPEPFGPLVRRLEKYLGDIDKNISALHQEYGQIRAETSALDWNNWRALFQMPSHWYQVRQETRILVEENAMLQKRVRDAEVIQQKLERLGWELAREARTVFEKLQVIIQALNHLRASEIHDKTLDTAIQQAESWEENLNNRVPVYFISEDENSVLQQADKNTIVRVNQVILEARPQISHLLEQAQTWENRHKELTTVLGKIAETFRDLSSRFSELEAHPNHPIEWNRSRSLLSQVRQQIQDSGAATKRRTLDEVQADLDRSAAISIQMEALAQTLQRVSEQHAELVSILEAPELQQGEEWRRGTHKLAEQVQGYHPDNWPRTDAVSSLSEELRSLTELQRKVLTAPSTPLKETEVQGALENARRLAALHSSLRPRTSSIQTRLTEIRETERNIRDAVSRTRALLNQAESIIGSNPHLAKTSANEVRPLVDNLDELYNDLSQPEVGLVDKKAQNASALIRKAEQAGNRWMEQITADLDDMKSELAEKVAVLNQIGALDDPVIGETKKLLANVQPEEPGGKRVRQKVQLPFAEVVPGIKRKNEEWQRCIAALRALEDIEQPVFDRYDHAEQQREHAIEALAHAIEIIPETRSWPPSQQMITTERRQFKLLEDQWEALREQPSPALQLVSKLSELSEGYQSLAGKVRHMVERAEEEQERIREFERRLDESKMLWQYHLNAYSDNPVARDEIDSLLEKTEQEFEAIQQRYERGSIPYNQVIQNLRMLCQKLDGAMAAVDNRQVIDINGVIQKRM